MSTVVQSTCPGCKQPLRIPSDWLTQAIRCKHCGLVLQVKSSVAAHAPRSSGTRPAVSPRTPSVPARRRRAGSGGLRPRLAASPPWPPPLPPST